MNLKTIYIHCNSIEAYENSKSDAFLQELQRFKVNQGSDVEIHGYIYNIYHCEPVLRGYIDENTNCISLQFDSNQEEACYTFGHLKEYELIPKQDHHHLQDWICRASSNTLISIGAFHGEFVKLYVNDQLRLVQMHVDDLVPMYKVWISTQLMYNISGSVAPQIARFTSLHKVWTDIPVAKAVSISLFANSWSQNRLFQEHISSLLLDYLKKDVLFCIDDVFQISLNPLLARAARHLDIDECMLREMKNKRRGEAVVYFRVDEINGKKQLKRTFRIDPKTTKVIQQGIITGLAPNFEPLMDLETFSQFNTVNNIVRASLHPKALEYKLLTSVLIYGGHGTGKKTLIELVSKKNGMNLITCNCYHIIQDTVEKTAASLEHYANLAMNCSPAILLLQHFEAFSESWTGQSSTDSKGFLVKTMELIQKAMESKQYVLLMATILDLESINPDLLRFFSHQCQIPMPSESERVTVLSKHIIGTRVSPFVDVNQISKETAGLCSRDLGAIVGRAKGAAVSRVVKFTDQIDQLLSETIQIDRQDFQIATEEARKSHSDSIGAPKIPNVQWEDIGGLDYVRDTILETIQLPLMHPELFQTGTKKRSGILLYGPPGTGKTLVAKAVATTLKLNFFSVKGPELLNMYIGESEANVRKIFQRARDAKPCVVFFDELDSVAPQRGDKGDSGGVMDRIVAQLLAELDGMSPTGDVFVIGATNRPDLLDSALLRPGRFDKLLYLGVSDTHERQHHLLKALTRKFTLDTDCDLFKVAEKCPFHLTGADFYALCSDAMLKAMSKLIKNVENDLKLWNASGPHKDHPHPTSSVYYLDHIATKDQTKVQVQLQDFMEALNELQPSVSPQELKRYEQIRSQFEPSTETKPPKLDSKGKGKMIE